MQPATTEILSNIPQEMLENVIKDLPVCWVKCVHANGEYFEGDGL